MNSALCQGYHFYVSLIDNQESSSSFFFSIMIISSHDYDRSICHHTYAIGEYGDSINQLMENT